jgi:GntR family transcriptional regulator
LSIREGRYAEGTSLPSETQLAEMYDVTRMTARQAVDLLKNEGLVRSEHGRGVFVRQRPTVHRLARNRFTRQRRETGRGAYDVEMKELGFTPGVELVEVGPVTPQTRSPNDSSSNPASKPSFAAAACTPTTSRCS